MIVIYEAKQTTRSVKCKGRVIIIDRREFVYYYIVRLNLNEGYGSIKCSP